MSARLTRLDNGIRVVTDRLDGVESVAVGVWVAVGTRHERINENGVAHMVEHMMFKGTPTRTALQIAEVIEDVGGSSNAYTAREMTAYYVHLLRDHLDLGLEVLADLIQHSTMPEEEVERERGVILQEIKMYEDDPDRLVFDNFQEAAYPDQSLGTPGLGREGIIRSLHRETLLEYVERHYLPENLVISASGAIDHDIFAEKVGRLFTYLPRGRQAIPLVPARYAPRASLLKRNTEQTHLILGFRGIPRSDERYPAFRLLSSILGGGMSSRLFQEVREKRGLVYSIYSFYESFHDDGLLGIYAGTGHEHLDRLLPVVLDEIKGMMRAITVEELARARSQTKAGVLMARESTMTRADQQARSVINYGRPFEVERLIGEIEAVTVADISALARDIFHTLPTLAVIGAADRVMTSRDIHVRITG